MWLRVSGPFNPATNTILVEDLEVTQTAGNKNLAYNGTPLDITSITFVLDICGSKNTLTPEVGPQHAQHG